MDLNLKDIEPDAVIAKAFVNDFVSDNATGNPRIITDPNQKSPQSIKDFVHGLSDVPLAKGEQKKVTLTISVPKNQPPGAYYGIIRYRAIPQVAANSNQGVSLTASVGAIVLVTVPGNIKDQVQLTGIHIYNKQNEHSFFLTKP
ncbi:MAG TPA: hypothetical protein VHL11_19865, partial [Phototrophicaceae bacterium]|nr:hypothetical protein [Phototrophicaceae bacterium]